MYIVGGRENGNGTKEMSSKGKVLNGTWRTTPLFRLRYILHVALGVSDVEAPPFASSTRKLLPVQPDVPVPFVNLPQLPEHTSFSDIHP